MAIYRKFAKQTDNVVQYLNVARQFEHHTRVQVPKLKHAPVHLGKQLDEYLRAPDFETHRRQYLAELEAKKKSGRSVSSSGIAKLENKTSASGPSKPALSNANGATAETKPPETSQTTKAPDRDLIDFFDSIEQNQTPMAVHPPSQAQAGLGLQAPTGTVPFQQAQQTGLVGNGFMAQQTGFGATNPFQQPQQQQQPMSQMYTGYAQQPSQPLQPAFTGAGFGGFTPQPSFQPGNLGTIPQDGVAAFQTGTSGPSLLTPQTTNPFRASMMMASQPTGQAQSLLPPTSPSSNRLSTNPFAKGVPQQAMSQPTGAESYQQQHGSAPAPLQSMPTGTNPFARTSPPAQASPASTGTPNSLVPQPTGVTNPFRQSTFVNHATGTGWQHNQTPLGGGLDQIPTVPVFPRPPQQTPWQQ
jgi:hypothetical protein